MRRSAVRAAFQEHGSGGAEDDRPLVVVRQFTAELLFTVFDLLGQRWLGHLQPLRGTAEVELFGDRDEVPGLPDLDHDSLSLLLIEETRPSEYIWRLLKWTS